MLQSSRNLEPIHPHQVNQFEHREPLQTFGLGIIYYGIRCEVVILLMFLFRMVSYTIQHLGFELRRIHGT